MIVRTALWCLSLFFTAGVLEAMAIDCRGGICSDYELKQQTPLTGMFFKALEGN